MEQQSHPRDSAKDASPDAPPTANFLSFQFFWVEPLHALETSRFHFIDAPQPELYDVIADPEERRIISRHSRLRRMAVSKTSCRHLFASIPYTPAAIVALG